MKNVANEKGQVLVIGLFVVIGLTLISISVANVGMMVAEKIHLQDTVDAAAYSAAVTQARYMNLSAYINRAIVSNYDTMAFTWALWAMIDALDHGMAIIVAALYEISFVLFAFVITAAAAAPVDLVADGLAEVHSLAHTFNHELNDFFAQDQNDRNGLIEKYNVDVLTLVQGFLYASAQTARYDVVREVAREMDPEIRVDTVLEMGAETVNYDELARAVDYVIRDPEGRSDDFADVMKLFNKSFNKMMGDSGDANNPLYLAAVTEASLNPFAAGRTREGDKDQLRRAGAPDLLSGFMDVVETIAEVACEGATLSFGDCDYDLSMELGSFPRTGWENDADEDHVPFVTRKRLREVNQFGFRVHFEGFPDFLGTIGKLIGNQGHTSSDQWGDVGNCANATLDFDKGVDFGRAWESMQLGCQPGAPISLGGLNSMNMLQASLMVPVGALYTPPLVKDDHWDGTYKDVEPVDSWELPIYGGGSGLATTVEYQAKIAGDGFEAEDGVPRYDWIVDLDNVGFPNYFYPEDGAQARPAGTSAGGNNNLLTGPSIAVVGIKEQSKINNIQGLNIGNPYSMTAISRAQVYYLRSRKRPNERPSLFNPHWVARFAPLNSADAPALFREGLPYLSSVGIPIHPTH